MEEYKKAIMARYNAVKNDRYPDILLHPTPANLKTLCTILFDMLGADDRIIYMRFFKMESPDVGLDFNDIKKYDVDKFRPLVRFLKGGAPPKSHISIELLAILVDFQPRPLKKFIITKSVKTVTDLAMVNEPSPVYGKEEETEEGDLGNERNMNEEDIVTPLHQMHPEQQAEKTAIIPQRFFAVPNRAVIIRANRIKLGLLLLLIICGGIYGIKSVFTEKGCMIWKGDHYEGVPCDLEVNAFAGNNVIPLNKELLMYQKKINATDTTTFFNADRTPRVWYIKLSNEECEYFTHPGKHPETNKELKPITPHIIYYHIKNKK